MFVVDMTSAASLASVAASAANLGEEYMTNRAAVVATHVEKPERFAVSRADVRYNAPRSPCVCVCVWQPTVSPA